MILYNINYNEKERVNMEFWIDENNDGNWKQVYQLTDPGTNGDGGWSCGGDPDQIITWGGPIAQFRIDGANKVDVKNLSIREIGPNI